MDELYDGPFCILSVVDNHNCKRLMYEVLDHDATQRDVVAFFQRFQAILLERGLSLHGITTDGSELYPKAIKEVFGSIPHQLCEFHVLRTISKAVLKAVSQARKTLSTQKPTLPRGRPTKQTRKLVHKAQRIQQKISDLFSHRFLFVKRRLTPAELQTFQHITRGLPHLRTLRTIMDEVYRLFDRRCRVSTALTKLTRLRQKVKNTRVKQALQPLFSPNLEKALTFLDDKLLPSTSNAVERGNRRYRKMQKSVYRTRTLPNISNRIALDMFREAFAPSRSLTLHLLHHSRATSPPSASR